MIFAEVGLMTMDVPRLSKFYRDVLKTEKLSKKGRKPSGFLPFSFFHGSLFLSPHSHMPSRMGMRDFPLSVRLYSTLGGI